LREGLINSVGLIVFFFAALLLRGTTASAQVTPAAGYTPPDDTPSIKLGVTIFTDYTYQQSPDVKDADGNSVDPNQFNVSRAYINVTGNISHIIAFRITPDVVRESGLLSLATGNAVSNDSLVFRVKYAFAQFNLDDWMPHGSWVRLGIQQTPYIDFVEGIYRYRFQGTVFPEREGFLTSSDAGVTFHTNIPKNYGDVHVGIYNGDGYAKAEANDQKAFQMRGTLRPLPMGAVLRGLRLTVFYDNDRYVQSDVRNRFIFSPTFEHKYVNAGFDYLNTEDRPLATAAKLEGEGYSFWITPKSTKGIEGLFRYDHEKPNKDASPVRERTIAGIAYWFPHQGTVSTALLLDYEQVDSKHFTPSVPKQQRIAVHGLVNF
jgi:hypothetical protein